MKKEDAKRLLPFILSLLIIVLDQVTKTWIVKNIPEGSVGYSFLNDFLWIVHVRNTAVAFSMGDGLPLAVKYIFFIGLPIALMVLLTWGVYSHKFDKEISTLQRWCLAGILGGGMGNLIDRIFRNLRVVDWISVNFYGFLGFERFPTWNVGDGCVVVSVILLLITLIIDDVKNKKKMEA